MVHSWFKNRSKPEPRVGFTTDDVPILNEPVDDLVHWTDAEFPEGRIVDLLLRSGDAWWSLVFDNHGIVYWTYSGPPERPDNTDEWIWSRDAPSIPRGNLAEVEYDTAVDTGSARLILDSGVDIILQWSDETDSTECTVRRRS